MRKSRENSAALCGAATLLGAAGIAAFCLNQSQPQASSATAEPTQITTAAASTHAATAAALAAQGRLWEPGATPDQRARTAIPVVAEPLRAAVGQAIGNRVKLQLSDRFPALAGEVTASSVQDDGTIVTHLRIDGDPQGSLALQENKKFGFFLGQLTYENYPVAYEFRPSGSGLMVTRHALSDLLCSTLGPNLDSIEAMGLPAVDDAKVPKANQRGETAIARHRLSPEAQESEGTTVPGLSVTDASLTLDAAGFSNMIFTIGLSPANPTQTVTVNYATQDGTAVAGIDYTAVGGTVSFAPGTTSATVFVPIIDNSAQESTATFILWLSSPVNAVITIDSATGAIVDDDTLGTTKVPILNSLPGATAVAYLDMDGQVVSGTSWFSGKTITARGISSTFTQAQMTEIWRRIAEDYAPFAINVSTEESVYLAAASNRRIRCIITPDNEWYGRFGGVAYVNSFTWTGDTPCWIFSDQLKNAPSYIAESGAHEIGHTLGLRHDGRTSPVEGYYAGLGSGEVGWAPIMGVGYYKSLVQWSRGEYTNANNKEDDLAMITSKNGFTYRVDQQPATPAGAPALAVSGTAVFGSGTIETRDDADTFAFTTTGGTVKLSVLGAAVGQNLDILAEILDPAGTVIATANPDTLTDATISATLPAGTHYLRVSGVGRGAALVVGYTDYGSLGQYTVSGTVP